MEALRKLPIGEQSFAKLRTEDRLYVDKTEYIYKMVHEGTYYFLSRPRRFGKSLLLSTMEAYFLGQRELFDGLYIAAQEEEWIEYPVMHIDFSLQSYESEQDLHDLLNVYLSKQEEVYDSNENETSLALRFGGIIERANKKTGKGVVILIDEYDKPLLEAIGNEALQERYRKMLRGFYGVLKGLNQYIRFVLLTGITKFSKVSIFSDLNNLRDISRVTSFACICGLTDEEVDRDLSPYIQRYAEQKDKSYDVIRVELQSKYDGYHFVDKTPGLYNPYSVMNALWYMEMSNFWFETGTPIMLVKLFKQNNYSLPSIEKAINTISLDTKDDDGDNIVPLLYQSGYVSIERSDEEEQLSWLTYPNEEVRDGFFQFLLPYYTSVQKSRTKAEILNFVNDIREGRVELFLKRLQALFANFQYDAQRDSDTEEHFRNVLYVLCVLLGLKVKAEYMTSDGRIDLLIRTERYVYIIECKIDSTARVALDQIREKKYELPWAVDEREIISIGLNFSTEKRRPNGWIATNSKGEVISEYNEEDAVERKLTWAAVRKILKERGIKLYKNQEIVLKAIVKKRTITYEEISATNDVPLATVKTCIVALKEKTVLVDKQDGQWVLMI